MSHYLQEVWCVHPKCLAAFLPSTVPNKMNKTNLRNPRYNYSPCSQLFMGYTIYMRKHHTHDVVFFHTFMNQHHQTSMVRVSKLVSLAPGRCPQPYRHKLVSAPWKKLPVGSTLPVKAAAWMEKLWKHGMNMDELYSWWLNRIHLKNMSQIGNLPQIGVKIKSIWNHHLDESQWSYCSHLKMLKPSLLEIKCDGWMYHLPKVHRI